MPMLAMMFAEFGSTGADEMSVFHGLSDGKNWTPLNGSSVWARALDSRNAIGVAASRLKNARRRIR